MKRTKAKVRTLTSDTPVQTSLTAFFRGKSDSGSIIVTKSEYDKRRKVENVATKKFKNSRKNNHILEFLVTLTIIINKI